MNSNSQKMNANKESCILTPSHRLPIIIIIFGISLFLIPNLLWPAILISSFGVFLLIQSFTLKLEINADDLIVLQLGKELRRFPFNNWLAWRIILPELPGLLYFREKASPHLLPILFDPIVLKRELQKRVGSLEKPKKSND